MRHTTYAQRVVVMATWGFIVAGIAFLFWDGQRPDVGIAEPAMAFIVEIPGQVEDYGPPYLIATGLRGLGASPDCPGECLVYVDADGTEVWFRFLP